MKFHSLLIALCLVFVPTAAFAGPLWHGVAVGTGIPFGDLGDVASTGFNVSANFDYEINTSFSVGGEIGWQFYGGNHDLETLLSAFAGTSVDVITTTIPILAHGKFIVPVGSASDAYAKVALGMYRARFEVGGGSASDNALAVGLGGGWTHRIADRRYGLEGMFHAVSTEGSSTNAFIARVLMQFGGGGI